MALDDRKQKLHYGTTPQTKQLRENIKGAVEVAKMVSPDYLIEINAIAVVQ
jgi:enamine deaminase RidA (YjgF/YER057c/UK114 family)